jgi:hypothetical protein
MKNHMSLNSHPLARTDCWSRPIGRHQPEYRLVVAASTANRDAFLSHRMNESVLWGLNLELDRKTYYNLARPKAMSYDGLKALIATSPS